MQRVVRQSPLVFGVLVASLLAPWTPAGAAARVAPSVHLTFAHSRVTAGQEFPLSVTSSHLPSAAKLHLQRTIGKGHSFKTIERLTATRGSFMAPAVPMGRHLYRVIAVRHSHIVAISAIHTIYSYGTVTITQLCKRSPSSQINITGDCSNGTIQVGTLVYEYALVAVQRNHKAGGDPTVAAFHSSCRRATINYAVSNDQQAQGAKSFGSSLTQTNSALESSSSTPQNVGTAVFKISSRDWDLEFWSNDKTSVFSNVRFSCWSKSGAS
jgi:hypothetical protein